MKFEERYATNPYDLKSYDTQRIRKDFLIENLFEKDNISLVYSLYDRFIAGGAVPIGKELLLETFDSLKADYFLQRRELGIINIGGKGKVVADGQQYEMNYKDGLYLGKEVKEVYFISEDPSKPAKFYFNSTPAHHQYPSKLMTLNDAEKVVLGTLETANHRQINKLMVNSVLPTCQLQMGMTELRTGSVWNTMPAHTHNRRMEVYLYFEVPEDQAVCHFMGEPEETRHIWMKNEQAVISPPWSIHSGAGTSNYTFVWGMAGENLDYGDMDVSKIVDLR
jgi:4-deoxy-L-threo-5-hexosulose-uronate ketol-isomerase